MKPPNRFFWIDPHGEGRNRYVMFRRELELSAGPTAAELHIFVDTRYRLSVNGHVVGHGPARFFPSHPCYDTIDLLPYLSAGRNCIAVLANSLHCSTFQSERSTGGFFVAGHIHTGREMIDLGDPSAWRAHESPGHEPHTHCLSFAIGPTECLDLRRMPAGWDLPDFDDLARIIHE